MASIMQGTTPSLKIQISTDDLHLSNVTALELYIRNGSRLTTYTAEDLDVDTEENTVTKHFSVEETAALDPRKNITVQARFWVGDAVIGINKITIGVADMMGVGADG